jgi:uncharacterized membrane protein
MAGHVQRHIPLCILLASVAACSGTARDNNAGNQANAVVANEAAAPAAANAVDTEAATNTAAAAASSSYHANGTEPFWALTIAGGQMIYQPMEGPTVTVPMPPQMRIPNGYVYPGNRLAVEVQHRSCNNGMSDETFADTVHVTVGGDTLNGCGGWGAGAH